MYLTSVQTPGLTCVLRILRSADDLLRPSSCSMLCSIAAGWNTHTHTVGQIQIQQETSSLYSLSWCSYCEGEDERPGEEAEHVGVFTEETADQQPNHRYCETIHLCCFKNNSELRFNILIFCSSASCGDITEIIWQFTVKAQISNLWFYFNIL